MKVDIMRALASPTTIRVVSVLLCLYGAVSMLGRTGSYFDALLSVTTFLCIWLLGWESRRQPGPRVTETAEPGEADRLADELDATRVDMGSDGVVRVRISTEVLDRASVLLRRLQGAVDRLTIDRDEWLQATLNVRERLNLAQQQASELRSELERLRSVRQSAQPELKEKVS